MWKDVLSSVAASGKVLAEWELKSGVKFQMFVPSLADMGEETIQFDSDVRFDEIEQMTIRGHVQLGRLTASNDIEGCARALRGRDDVRVVVGSDEICIQSIDSR